MTTPSKEAIIEKALDEIREWLPGEKDKYCREQFRSIILSAINKAREPLLKWLNIFVNCFDGESLMHALQREHGDKYEIAYGWEKEAKEKGLPISESRAGGQEWIDKVATQISEWEKETYGPPGFSYPAKEREAEVIAGMIRAAHNASIK